eukprot:07316.XXX_390469_390612_1 [CDS] Oithona nana genome sequencing.
MTFIFIAFNYSLSNKYLRFEGKLQLSGRNSVDVTSTVSQCVPFENFG